MAWIWSLNPSQVHCSLLQTALSPVQGTLSGYQWDYLFLAKSQLSAGDASFCGKWKVVIQFFEPWSALRLLARNVGPLAKNVFPWWCEVKHGHLMVCALVSDREGSVHSCLRNDSLRSKLRRECPAPSKVINGDPRIRKILWGVTLQYISIPIREEKTLLVAKW